MFTKSANSFGWGQEVTKDLKIDERRLVLCLASLWTMSYTKMITMIALELEKQGEWIEITQAPKKGAMFLLRNSGSKTIIRYIHGVPSGWCGPLFQAHLSDLLESERADQLFVICRKVIIDVLPNTQTYQRVKVFDGIDLIELLEKWKHKLEQICNCPLCGAELQLKRNFAKSEQFAWVCPNTRLFKCNFKPTWANHPGTDSKFTLPHRFLLIDDEVVRSASVP
jgi:hypothetical protein